MSSKSTRSFCSIASCSTPAAIRPASGRLRSSIGSAASWIARDMFGSRVISPFFSRAFRWQTTPLGELMPNWRPISRTVGP